MSYIGNTNTTQAFTPAVDFFSGNASTTAFTLSRPVASVAQVQAVISNVPQDPGSAYTVSGSTITFTSAPPSGTNNIYVSYTSPITQVIAPGQGTVTTTSLASSTGTGAVVLATSPTLTTPVLGAASATSITVDAGAVGTPSITTAGDTNTGIFFPAADTIAFSEGGAEAVRIDSSGNVGIGTTTPSYRIDAVGAGSPANGIMRTSSNLTNSTTKYGYYTVGHYTNATVPFGFIQGESNSTENNVHIGGGAGEITAATRIDFYTASNNTTTNGTERMRIISSGQVGINVTPAAGNTFRVINIGSDNAVQFGNASNGVYLPSGGTSFSSYSDIRLKNITGRYETPLEDIAKLDAIKFTWKNDEGNKPCVGVSAQSVETVIPEAIDRSTNFNAEGDTTEYLSVKYTELIPLMIASIQELKAINDTQASTITALTARITALENT
jgi:hypothetical protein